MFIPFLVGLLWLYLAFAAGTSGVIQAGFWINIGLMAALLGFVAGGFTVPGIRATLETKTLAGLSKTGLSPFLLKIIDVATIAALFVNGLHWIAAGWAVLFVLALYIRHAAAAELIRRIEASKDPA